MTEPIDFAWAVLKQDEDDAHILHPDDDFDARGMIFIEDYGEVPKEDYYNAEWWWNHPHGHINSIRDEYESIEELQADLDKERGELNAPN